MTTPIDVTPTEGVATFNLNSSLSNTSSKLSMYEMMKVLAVQSSQDLENMRSLQQKANEANTANIISKRLAGAESSDDLLRRIDSLQVGGMGNLDGLKAKIEKNFASYNELKAKAESYQANADKAKANSKKKGILNGLTFGILNGVNALRGVVQGNLAEATFAEADNAKNQGEALSLGNQKAAVRDLDAEGSKKDALQSKADSAQANMNASFTNFGITL